LAAAPGLLDAGAALDARGPFERLCAELSSEGCRTTPVIRHALGLLLACFLAAARRPPGRPGLTSGQRTRLIRWTREHLAHRPEVVDLARVVGLSPDYFARRFRASFGISPRRWLAEERIRGVARALIDRDDPIHAVAADFGFEDPSHFGRQFRRVIGRSPGAWRREPAP